MNELGVVKLALSHPSCQRSGTVSGEVPADSMPVP